MFLSKQILSKTGALIPKFMLIATPRLNLFYSRHREKRPPGNRRPRLVFTPACPPFSIFRPLPGLSCSLHRMARFTPASPPWAPLGLRPEFEAAADGAEAPGRPAAPGVAPSALALPRGRLLPRLASVQAARSASGDVASVRSPGPRSCHSREVSVISRKFLASGPPFIAVLMALAQCAAPGRVDALCASGLCCPLASLPPPPLPPPTAHGAPGTQLWGWPSTDSNVQGFCVLFYHFPRKGQTL